MSSSFAGDRAQMSASTISYADNDPEATRASIGATRIKRLGLGSKQFLARMLFSDAHALNALGRNARGDKKVTRIKMDKPIFDALRIALEDSDARVRLEDQIPPMIPHILGVAFAGGFLNDQAIHLSRTLAASSAAAVRANRPLSRRFAACRATPATAA